VRRCKQYLGVCIKEHKRRKSPRKSGCKIISSVPVSFCFCGNFWRSRKFKIHSAYLFLPNSASLLLHHNKRLSFSQATGISIILHLGKKKSRSSFMAPKATATPETIQAGTSFLSAFPKYIRTDISCKHVDDEKPHELLEFVQENLKAFCKTLASSHESLEATQWPSLFVVSSADGLASKETRQDRGCFLLGLNDTVPSTDLEPSLRDWQKELRKQPLFKDYYPPPLFEVRLVNQADLGTLTLDQWMWPEALIVAKPQIFNTALPDGEESFGFLANAQPAPGTRSSTPKKLTPASAILNRLKWDEGYESKEYSVVYEDRHDGLMEIGVDLWTTESTEEHFIPMHRIRSIRKKTTGQTVWHREGRIDLISGGI
jgi:uncharacterized protein (UPF0248 family)